MARYSDVMAQSLRCRFNRETVEVGSGIFLNPSTLPPSRLAADFGSRLLVGVSGALIALLAGKGNEDYN